MITALFVSGLFGTACAIIVRWLRLRVSLEARAAILVCVGMGGTVAISAIVIGLEAAAFVLCAFVCSGLPMIVEEYSWTIKRDISRLAQLQEVGNDAKKETTESSWLGRPGLGDYDQESDL